MVGAVNIPVLVLVIVAALVLVGWLIRRNLKDEEEFERELNDPGLETDRHKDADS